MAKTPSSSVTGRRPSIFFPIASPPHSDSPSRPAQHDIAEPASVLHVDGQVQSEHVLECRPVHTNPSNIASFNQHCVYRVARQEAHREKDEDAQDEQRGDDEQHPPDDVRSHVSE